MNSAAHSSLLKLLHRANELHLPGGRFLLAPPFANRETCNAWLGDSLCWIPDQIVCDIPVYGVVSSRMGRRPHRRLHWFAMLRRAIEATLHDDAALMIVQQTAAESWLAHACRLFQCPSVTVAVGQWNGDVDCWIDRVAANPPTEIISVSPPASFGGDIDERDKGDRRSGRTVKPKATVCRRFPDAMLLPLLCRNESLRRWSRHEATSIGCCDAA
ncbi:MAG: hypothetical protein R3C05_22460 [Pirellulaceae bacterium]